MKKSDHAAARQRPYFEGWYFKLTTRDGRALALIPARHIQAGGARHASLQVISSDRSWWIEYPGTCEDRFCFGANRFSAEGLSVSLDAPECSLHGALSFGPLKALKSDIMGPFRFLPGMECAHGVVSMAHTLRGALTLNGEVFDFTGGTGYIETDRGRSFPSAYLWTQCVWQTEPLCGLMLSVASIPLSKVRFTGCICAVFHQGQEYRLATYRGARAEAWSAAGAVIRQGRACLEVELLRENGQPLLAPIEGAMRRTIRESLCAEVCYRFRVGKKLLFEHTDSRASFEYSQSAPPDRREGTLFKNFLFFS